MFCCSAFVSLARPTQTCGTNDEEAALSGDDQGEGAWLWKLEAGEYGEAAAGGESKRSLKTEAGVEAVAKERADIGVDWALMWQLARALGEV